MIILGIDPGTTRIGFGIIKVNNNKIECISYGTIENSAQDKYFLYKNVSLEISKLVSKYKPRVAVIEKLFFFKNHKTIMSVSEMRGVIMLSLFNSDIKIIELTPLQVKSYLCGYGSADKKQVQRMVKIILKLDKDIKPDDAADALALAISSSGYSE